MSEAPRIEKKKQAIVSKLFDIVFLMILVGLIVRQIPIWWQAYEKQGLVFGPVEVKTISGESIVLPEINKKVIYVFWATWCVPCQRQIQLLQKGVDAGDMSLDQVKLINLGEERELVVEYINNHQVKMATYLSEADAWRKFDVVATPTILFIGKESKIEYVTTGFSPMINFRIANFLNP